MAQMSDEDIQEHNAAIERFLSRIRSVETSNGNNLNSKRVLNPNDPNYGAKAGGSAQIMPNTAYQIINSRDTEGLEGLKKLFRTAPTGDGGRTVTNPDAITNILNQNPDIDNKIQHALAERQWNRYDGDEQKMAQSWNKGMNLDPNNSSKLTPHALQHSDYVQKFNNANPQEMADVQASEKISPSASQANFNPPSLDDMYKNHLQRIYGDDQEFLPKEDNSDQDDENVSRINRLP